MASIHPYVTFDNSCEEAFLFYKSVFGNEFTNFQKFKDAPSDNAMSESEGEKIMHVALPIGNESVLMGSDRPEMYGKGIQGTSFSISIDADSEEQASSFFNGLSQGGRITMALEKTFWGAYFGMFTDKFGIQWMVNYDYNK